MTERKLTDEEVIKALETVSYGGHSCEKCKFKTSKGDDRCGLKGCNICRLALDLINRKNAEIERYEAQRKEIFGECIKILAKIEELKVAVPIDIAMAKSEAIKEFAEEFKKRCIRKGFYPVWIKNILADLVKEKTEGQG